ncbi:RagB/SusD family nutrient uptake outer membrane protein [Olivibacter sp. SDN3]|nr:RagB/SusD family nutrient uptake outer membrane protein [Olivibacter sp. SDN3]
MGSCQKQLEEVQPQTDLGRDLVLSDPNAARTLYYGIYSSFRSFHATFFQLGEMRSDIWADGLFTESEDGGLRNLYTHNININQVPFAEWANFYQLIDRVNTVIALFPQTTLPDEEKQQIMAEMYGLRAYIYYTMLKTWGGVPLTVEPVASVSDLRELYKARSAPELIMEQIKADIESSLTAYQGNNSLPAKRVFWNRLATLTLKGDVYLWSGTHFGGNAADYSLAREALEEVAAQEGSTLGLQEDYANVFDPTAKNNNKEIIFALNYELDQEQMMAYGNFLVNTTQAATLVFGTPENNQPVNVVYPLVGGASRAGLSLAMIEKLNVAGDSRFDNTFRIMYRNTPEFPVAATMLTKFIGRVNAGAQLYDNDFPIYRYAEVLLLLAEAKVQLGIDPSTEINAIRERAYGADFPVYRQGGAQQDMEAVLDEGLREFIAEGKRWWALRRAGDEWVFRYVNPVYLRPNEQYKFLLPITQGMLNADPELAQTPGYE